jgi:hypothetical protein
MSGRPSPSRWPRTFPSSTASSPGAPSWASASVTQRRRADTNGRFQRWVSSSTASTPPAPRSPATAVAWPLSARGCWSSARSARSDPTPILSRSHTLGPRELLGHNALLAPELACVVDDHAESGRARARAYAKLYLGLRNYTRNLLAFGFTEDDIADGGSDRLIDAVVPQGTADGIAAVAREHLSAGADHVCLQAAGVTGIPRSEWTALAAALGLRR